MRKPYASDVSREKFKEIQPLLQSVRKRTKPTTVDLYEVFCAVLYLLRTGCQWRMLPRDFPPWGTVYSYFAKWSKPDKDGISVLERELKVQVGAARKREGRNSLPTLLIVDAQSVKNTDTAGFKGYDAGKKVSGIKRHIGVDTQGLPHMVEVTTTRYGLPVPAAGVQSRPRPEHSTRVPAGFRSGSVKRCVPCAPGAMSWPIRMLAAC